MNHPVPIPAAIEDAILAIIADQLDDPSAVWLRTSHKQEQEWRVDGRVADRAFPQIYICARPVAQTTQRVCFSCDVEITISTHILDDPTCQARTDLWAAVENAVIPLCDLVADAGVKADFAEAVTDQIPDFNFGGAEMLDGTAPSATDDVSYVTTGATIHFSITDTED